MDLIRREDCARALRRGIDFLRKSQLPSGEFRTLAGASATSLETANPDPSIFTTVNVATCLLRVREPAAETITRQAAEFLKSEMLPGGLWRFWTKQHPGSAGMPPDVDDTSCASEFLRSRGYHCPDNRRILLANRNRHGLFRTWMTPTLRHLLSGQGRALLLSALVARRQQRIFFSCGSEVPRRDTFESVVNANALLYLGDCRGTRAASSWLSDVVQSRRASVTDRYYQSELALLYAVVRGIEKGVASLSPLREQIASIIRAHENAPLSELDLALYICVQASIDPSTPSLDGGLVKLLQSQRADGSWPSCAFYYDGYSRALCWGSSELTTGFCVEALARRLDVWGL